MISQTRLRSCCFLVLLVSNLAVHAQAATVGKGAVLQPGDHLRITVLGDDKSFSGEFEVAPDSTLKHPLYNQLRVGGIAVSMLKQTITTFLKQYQRDPHLEVEPLLKVVVSGEVRTPSIYFLSPETDVAEAIVHAGGATERANLERVIVAREGLTVALEVDIKKPGARVPTIQSGDQISVVPQKNTLSGLSGLTPILGVAASLLSITYIMLSHR